jgi:hypothetical protein
VKYVRLNNNVVAEIIPEFDPVFPNVPIEQRYPAEFVKKLVAVDDNVEVRVGMVYDAETGTFSEPEPVTPSEPPDVPTVDPVTEANSMEILNVLLGVSE